jgi:hypothetical protein
MTINPESDLPSDDALAEREARAAAAEAGSIGGRRPDYVADEEQRAVEEAGGGVAEGFEQAERELVEHASHEDNVADPELDEFPPEEESDRSTAEYGEADDVDPSEGG